jgi:P22_AR N-terminal domain
MTTASETYRYCRLRIRYFDVDVPAVAIGRMVCFPLRALCKVIGINAQTQVDKLRADSAYTGALREDVPIPTIKGERPATCIRRKEVGRWLLGIDAARCAITARGPLERFQEELLAAADRWLFGDNSDVATDGTERTALPITGTLRLGECPRCGAHLCLEIDGTGNHLRIEGEEADD